MTSTDPRYSRLHQPHIAPLTTFVDTLREQRGGGQSVPYADPDDAGVNARVLLMLEAPGPRAMGAGSPRPVGGSGFISPTNNDATARMTLACRVEAGLTPAETLHWNVVPWYIGDGTRIRAATTADLVEALPATRAFVRLLPDLRVVVLMGRKAEDGWARLTRRYPDMAAIQTRPCPHPAPRSVNRLGARERVVEALRAAKDLAADRR